jgi:diaminopimelate epimerase
MLTPALTELAAALADNVTAALTPASLLQQYKQQQQQRWPNSEQQQHPQHLPEASVGEAGAVACGTAAAAAAAANAGSGISTAAAAAVPLSGGEEEARTAFKVVRHLVELMRDIKERCRWA